MANKKFSEFELKTTTSNVSHVVGYDGTENVRITPANFLDTTGGPYLPLAGGTMTGTNGVVFPDNFYLNLGTSSDFEIYHDGNNSYLKDQGTGELILASNGTGIKLEKTSGEKMIHALTDGAVELYYDSVKKFATTTTGVSVTGNANFQDNGKAIFGSPGNDLQIYHDGSNSVISDEGTGLLAVRGNEVKIKSPSTSEVFARFIENSSVELYYDGSKKFETINTGISVTGDGTFINTAAGVSTGIALYNNTAGANNRVAVDFYGNSTKYGVIEGGYGASEPEMNFLIGNPSAQILTLKATGSTFAGDVNILKENLYGIANLQIKGGVSGAGVIQLSGNGNVSGTDSFDLFQNSAGAFVYNRHNSPIAFATNSVERMRLDASGNLGLGTSNTGQGKFDILDAGDYDAHTGHAITINSNVSNAFTSMYMGADDSVDAAYIQSAARNTSFTSKKLLLNPNGGNLGVGTSNTNRSGLGVDHTVITVGQDTGMGMLELQGNRTSDADLGRVAWLNAGTRQAEIVSSRIDDNTSTQMLFRTSNAGSLATKMTIAKDGDVLLKGSNNPYTAANRGNITLNGSAGNIIAFTNNTSGTGYIFHDSTDLKILNAIAGNLTFSTNSTERMRLDASGNLLINTTATIGDARIMLEIGVGEIGYTTKPKTDIAYAAAAFRASSGTAIGNISCTTTATTYNTSSDYRLKEDLQDFKGLELVSKIPVYDYKWKADESRSYGVMAHELQEVLPQAVSGDKDAEEMQSVDYSKIVPLLVKSIQELKAEIELLKNK